MERKLVIKQTEDTKTEAEKVIPSGCVITKTKEVNILGGGKVVTISYKKPRKTSA